jgi:hypothetical protein
LMLRVTVLNSVSPSILLTKQLLLSMSELNSHLILIVTELESVPYTILLHFHLMLSVIGLESESPSVLLTRQV